MKVICVDNFNRDEYGDSLVCENVNQYYGKMIVDALNEKLSGEHSQDYYRLVEDDYELYDGYAEFL